MNDTLKRQLLHLFRKWLFFEIALPIFFLSALYWPVGPLVLKVPHLFEKVFSSADFLPLCALFLFGVFSEIEQAVVFDRLRSGLLETLRYGALFLGIVYLFLYGFLKLNYLKYSFPKASQPVDEQITFTAYFSLGALFLAVAYAFASKVLAIKATIKHTTGGP